jgi:dihydrofolate reductase
MQAPRMREEDPSGGFTQGGWAAPYWDNVMESGSQIAMSEPCDVLLGRNTYDSFAPHHSVNDSPLNTLNKYVVTSSAVPIPWQPTIEIQGDAPDAISALEDGPLLQVHGSHQLVQLLLQHGLVDEYRIWTCPVVLGAGKRLLGNDASSANLVLQTSETLKSGAVMSIYRKA